MDEIQPRKQLDSRTVNLIESAEMFGQWIGGIRGTNSGSVVLNVDEDRPTTGLLHVMDDKIPFAARAWIDSHDSGEITIRLSDIAPAIEMPTGSQLPKSVEITSKRPREGKLTGAWKSDFGTQGEFELNRYEVQAPRPSELLLDWAGFRQWAFDTCKDCRTWIFRGHRSAKQPLMTLFHRRGRRDLVRYNMEDVARLHRRVEAVVGKSYDMKNPVDYGALLNLGQHHGFPTPLLDWTESPFVAAFFAFERLPKTVGEDGPVRVFAFDSRGWPTPPFESTVDVGLFFVLRFLHARDNPRALPQQSVNIFSNLVDIERFVKWQEDRLKRSFLLRIDIPASERAVAMRELETMGITAASMFPGLDGACRSLAESWF